VQKNHAIINFLLLSLPNLSFQIRHQKDRRTMKLILLIANAFINTMGITQPSPQAANRAAWFIVTMLAAVIAAVATIAILAIHWASHH
jgi:ABC-type amino acid transport system permease subunit